MNIGFTNIYSWRPHIEHLIFLSRLMESAGHKTSFLTCDSSVSDCYTRLLRGRSRLRECSTCIAGGVRSFPVSNVTSISRIPSRLNIDALDRLALSSSCTLTRTESDAEWNDPPVVEMRQWLHDAVGAAYESALRWIDRERLDAVVCFNGRMDMTRAITLACENTGIPFVTHERPWFGHGLHLTPNDNCLALEPIHAMVADYAGKPLTLDQARQSARLLAGRFLRKNDLEWRQYNEQPKAADWPTAEKDQRVLVVPSSRNEFAGHPDYATSWPDNGVALDGLIDWLGLRPGQIVVRCHPNWAERIGRNRGDRSLEFYNKWASDRGIHLISSADQRSTQDLIAQSDIVVTNGGSAAIEAGALGKLIYCLGPSRYTHAGFVHSILGPQDFSRPIDRLDPYTIVQKTLRYVAVNAFRHPQYVNHVRAVSPTAYSYYAGGCPDRLTSMLSTGTLTPDDPAHATADSDERLIAESLLAKNWAELAHFAPVEYARTHLDVKRRAILRWVGPARELLRRGDR